MAIISIFGLAGTGTSSCGRLLAEKLNYRFYSTGNLFRQCAVDKNMSFEDYEKLVHDNPEMDKEFDQKVESLGHTEDNFVIDSRLAWHFIPHSFKIKFICEENLRLARVSTRDGISLEEATERTRVREAGHDERFKRIYQIEDYKADQNFDLIFDTTGKTAEETVQKILDELHRLSSLL